MTASLFSDRFIVSPGTQVVLRRDLPVMGQTESRFKKEGSVGVVEESPSSLEDEYLVRFSDGQRVRALHRELVVRRKDSPIGELPGRDVEEFEKHLIYRVVVGSRAFGLADESSDSDEKGIFLPPADWHWSLQPLPEQVEFKRANDGRILDQHSRDPADDVCWWEIEKFVRLALKSNPSALEVLFVPEDCVLHLTTLGKELREMRSKFLSKHLYKTYSGYVLSQFKRMSKDLEKGKPHRPKHACHLVRLLHSGIAALRGEGILVDVGPHREELLRIKRNELPFDEIYSRAVQLDREFQKAFDDTSLPEQPDVGAVDRYLIEARRQRV
jgi:predicted nucleotidyltransferase